ncbi:hypothetical protein HK103_003716 [Boothiomyces macroporosus]|uniref:Uncharacterized protein n=1 Tax=Boothiomyces macroporosus TaxID=261099 RepID=A0AAD5Y8V3_9FUNG|nr:hypothetical protein HK103_003716 [Boothiomyces macroporosus]
MKIAQALSVLFVTTVLAHPGMLSYQAGNSQGNGLGNQMGNLGPQNIGDSSFNQAAYHGFQMPRGDAEVLDPNAVPRFGKKGGRGLRIVASPKKVIIFSFNPLNNATTVLRFNVNKEPRLGVEWNHNRDLLKDLTPADVSFATRLAGLYEVNATSNCFWNTTGTVYRFGTWNWSAIAITWRNDSNSNATLYLNSIGSPFGAYGGPQVNLTVIVSADTFNLTNGLTIMPTGLKYDISIIGPVTYALSPPTSSSWKLVKRIFSSFQNSTFTNNGLSDPNNIGNMAWASNVTLDSQPGTISFDGAINVPPSLVLGQGDNTQRDDHLDFQCSKSLSVYSIPYFAQAFHWDPSVYVSESNAISAYSTNSSGSTTSTAGSSGYPSAGVSISQSGSLLSSICLVMLCAIILL